MEKSQKIGKCAWLGNKNVVFVGFMTHTSEFHAGPDKVKYTFTCEQINY